jgi:hypothetical protein
MAKALPHVRFPQAIASGRIHGSGRLVVRLGRGLRTRRTLEPRAADPADPGGDGLRRHPSTHGALRHALAGRDRQESEARHALPPVAQGLRRLQGGVPLLYEQQETGANARRTAELSSTYAMGISLAGLSPRCGFSSSHLQKIFFLRSIEKRQLQS